MKIEISMVTAWALTILPDKDLKKLGISREIYNKFKPKLGPKGKPPGKRPLTIGPFGA